MTGKSKTFLWYGILKFLILSSSFIFCFLIFNTIVFITATEGSISENKCLKCHQELGITELTDCTRKWAQSIHASVSVCCDECHGGDPDSPYPPVVGNKGYIGVPTKKNIPLICERCHNDPLYMRNYNIRIDEENQYKNSVHAKKLMLEGNTDVASCVDCHGRHNIQKVDDPEDRANHFNIAKTCAGCHANEKLMSPYGLPTDQFTQYKDSYHGRILYEQIEGKNPRLVPSCPGCHGIHGGKPAGVTQVAEACYNCHLVTKRYFQKSIHSLALKKNKYPRCIDCHGYHYIPRPNEELFVGFSPSHCGNCHLQSSKEYQTGLKIKALLVEAKDRVKKSQFRVNQIKKNLDIDISAFDLKMIDIHDSLYEAKSASHSQNIQTVNEIVQKIHRHTDNINKQVKHLYQEFKGRKHWLAEVLIFISLLFSLAAYQRHKLKR